MLSKERLAEIKGRLQPLLEREKRAQELLQSIPRSHFYIGLCGATYDGSPFDILPGFLTVRPVTNAPGIVHVCRAACLERTDYLGVARYSHRIAAELAVGTHDLEGHADPEFLHGLAWHTAALLKLRGAELLFCPASSQVSWDTIAAVDDQSVHFRMLDDVPRQIAVSGGREYAITAADLEWVRDRWDNALRLRDASSSRRFGLAFNIAYTWNHTQEPRIAVSNLWCGLDALFGMRTDRPVTQRLAERLGAWLPSTAQQEITELYDHRCDAVHGRWMDDDELGRVLQRTARLLRDSLIRCIDEARQTLPDWTG